MQLFRYLLLVVLANYAYTVGLAGNRLTATEAVHPGGGPRTINRVYQYDDLYRLTHESLGGSLGAGAAGYGYDPVGNRLTQMNFTRQP